MKESRITYSDGFMLNILSPTNRTISVVQNQSPLPANFITGSPGGAATPFIQLSPFSYIVRTSEHAGDLIAQIAVPYSPADIAAKGVQAANTYVAVLAADRRSWLVDGSTRNIQRAMNMTKLEKLTSVAGEYMLVGRQSSDMGNIFVSFGDRPESTVTLSAGVGVQEVEFIDGLSMSVQSNKTVNITVELDEGINPGTMNDNMAALNTFTWNVKMSDPNHGVDAVMMFPCMPRDSCAS